MADLRLPNFLILGAAKCGTTSLCAYLDQHPDVFFSTPKEPTFFEAEYERGLEYYCSRYFRGWRGEHAVGEARTHNLMLPYVPARIRESLPEAHLVALLRNPVDRAFSHWWHRHSRGLDERPFFESVRANRDHIERGLDFHGPEGEERWRQSLVYNRKNVSTRYDLYLELGHYAEQLGRYLELFPRSQIEVVFFEDLERNPEQVTQGLWRFLGVDSNRSLESTVPRNVASYRARSATVRRLGALPKPGFLKRWIPEAIQTRAGEYLKGRPIDPPVLEPEAEAWLLEHFAPHNRALERLLELELPDWFGSDPPRSQFKDAAHEG